MKFVCDQIAIAPKDPVAAKQLLSEMGAQTWAKDHVVAEGRVFGRQSVNEANLLFNYDLVSGKEFEILDYTDGPNWMDIGPGRGRGSVSHLGMHCSMEHLSLWRKFFAARDISVVQEVLTRSHTNNAIAGKRRYDYVIFGTRDILGVDLKFIVRHILLNAECLVCQTPQMVIPEYFKGHEMCNVCGQTTNHHLVVHPE